MMTTLRHLYLKLTQLQSVNGVTLIFQANISLLALPARTANTAETTYHLA